jgi:hypothetical protein
MLASLEPHVAQMVGTVVVAVLSAASGVAGAMLTTRAEKSKIEEAKAETEREKATDNLSYLLKQLDGAIDRNKDLEAQNIELYNEIFDLKNQLISMAYLVAYIQVLRELWREPPRLPDMPDIVRNALERFKN